jgi:hypothetical protein
VSKLSELNVVCGGRKSKGQRPEGFGGNFSGIADAASGASRTCRIGTSSLRESAYRPHEPVVNATPAAFGAVARSAAGSRREIFLTDKFRVSGSSQFRDERPSVNWIVNQSRGFALERQAGRSFVSIEGGRLVFVLFARKSNVIRAKGAA